MVLGVDARSELGGLSSFEGTLSPVLVGDSAADIGLGDLILGPGDVSEKEITRFMWAAGLLGDDGCF